MVSTYREIVFMIKDLLKLNTLESHFEEEHIIYIANQIRAMLLKQRYSDIRKDIPDINFQTITLDLSELTAGANYFRPTNEIYLRSNDAVPAIISINSVPSTITRVRGGDTNNTMLTFVNFDRLRFIGYNKWLSQIIYCALGPGVDTGYMYVKSATPLMVDDEPILPNIFVTSIFENPLEAYKMDAFIGPLPDLDYPFPLEAQLIPTLVDQVVKVLLGATYRPVDDANNSSDDLSDLMSFIRKNMKTPLTKAIEDGV